MENSKKHQKKPKKLNKKGLSITLCYYLRHGAAKNNIPIDSEGYVSVAVILALKEFKDVDIDYIRNVVKEDEKKRYQLRTDSSGQLFIRAVQGHSIKTLDHELMMETIEDPSLYKNINIVHGTFSKFLDLIMSEGLKTMSRNHIHFAMGYPEDSQVISGVRQGCDVFIELNLELAMRNGIKILKSANNVILTEGIMKTLSPVFFKKVFRINLNGDRELIFSNENFAEIRSKYSPRYIFILDFEANCSETETLKPQEIIEFPVIALDTWTNTVDEKNIFHYYVKPTHTKITTFCTKLTGITEEKVLKEGIELEKVLAKFDEFLQERPEIAKDFCFATCGNWDLNTCLKNEANFKKINLPTYFKKFINIKDVYGLFFGKNGKFGMVEMLNHLKIPLEGRHHSGIDDSRNLTKVIQAILAHKDAIIPKTYIKIVK